MGEHVESDGEPILDLNRPCWIEPAMRLAHQREVERRRAVVRAAAEQEASEIVLAAEREIRRVVMRTRHELVSLARAGMTPAQIAGQLNCSEKNVYSLLAEALGRQELSLEQALDLPEDLLMEVQDAFLDGEGELPPVSAVSPLFGQRVPEGVLHCVRAALAAEATEGSNRRRSIAALTPTGGTASG